ncbi:MAG: MATE family efflux transporter [Sphaerochaetaceae bacterium]|nr:MATE family efflux transporter [Sphaerochaetaceae bacterium]
MRKLTIPSVASMLIIIFNNMVDIFYVGQLGDPNKVAAISVATPIILILMVFRNMFGIAFAQPISDISSAIIGFMILRYMGKKTKKKNINLN